MLSSEQAEEVAPSRRKKGEKPSASREEAQEEGEEFGVKERQFQSAGKRRGRECDTLR